MTDRERLGALVTCAAPRLHSAHEDQGGEVARHHLFAAQNDSTPCQPAVVGIEAGMRVLFLVLPLLLAAAPMTTKTTTTTTKTTTTKATLRVFVAQSLDKAMRAEADAFEAGGCS